MHHNTASTITYTLNIFYFHSSQKVTLKNENTSSDSHNYEPNVNLTLLKKTLNTITVTTSDKENMMSSCHFKASTCPPGKCAFLKTHQSGISAMVMQHLFWVGFKAQGGSLYSAN